MARSCRRAAGGQGWAGNGETNKTDQRAARAREHAKAIFRDAEAADGWLRLPALALDGRCPLDLLNTDEGARAVSALIEGIARGNVV